MSSQTVQKVLDRLENIKLTGSGFTAQCPAHDDQRNSLSVSEGKDGRVLLHCHVGCDIKDVVSQLGLRLKDLFSV